MGLFNGGEPTTFFFVLSVAISLDWRQSFADRFPGRLVRRGMTLYQKLVAGATPLENRLIGA